MDLNIYLNLLRISAVSLVITSFEPFLNFKRMVLKTKKKDTIGWLIFTIFDKVTSCSKCLTFWSSLIILPIIGFDLYNTITFACITTIQTQILYKLSQTFFIQQ